MNIQWSPEAIERPIATLEKAPSIRQSLISATASPMRLRRKGGIQSQIFTRVTTQGRERGINTLNLVPLPISDFTVMWPSMSLIAQ